MSINVAQLALWDAQPKVIVKPPRGEYRDRVRHGITWPLVWCEEEQQWYVAERRLAIETFGVSPQSLGERLRADPVVSQGRRNILLPSASGRQPTICFPLDDLFYVIVGVETNACRLEVREDLVYLKTLARDVLRDVLIDGKMPEVLKERQAAQSDIARYDELKAISAQQAQIMTMLLTVQATLDGLQGEATGTRLDIEDMGRKLQKMEGDLGVVRAGYNGILVQEPELREVVRERPVFLYTDGTDYCLVDGVTKDPRYPGMIRVSFGEVCHTCNADLDKVVQLVLKEDRYNGGKSYGAPWSPAGAFLSDARKQGQTNIHKLVERAGGIRESGRIDVWWVWTQSIIDFGQFPHYIPAGEIFKYANDNGLFVTPMGV